jgi:hypothetical protein
MQKNRKEHAIMDGEFCNEVVQFLPCLWSNLSSILVNSVNYTQRVTLKQLLFASAVKRTWAPYLRQDPCSLA